MPPQGPDFILSSDIPYGELDVFVFNGLNIKSFTHPQLALAAWKMGSSDIGGQTNCGYGSHNFAELKLIENRSLSCGI